MKNSKHNHNNDRLICITHVSLADVFINRILNFSFTPVTLVNVLPICHCVVNYLICWIRFHGDGATLTVMELRVFITPFFSGEGNQKSSITSTSN